MRKALDLIGRENRKRWALLVVIALVASGFEMLGAVLVFLLIGLVADPNGEIELPLLGDVRGMFSDVDERTLLLWVLAVVGVFFLLRGLVQIGSIYIQRRVSENTGARLANRLIAGYLRSPYAVHLRRNSAELIRNGHQAVQELVSQVLFPIIKVTAETLLAAGLLAVLLVVAPMATVIAVAVVGGAAALVLLVVQPRLKRLGRIGHDMQKEGLRSLQQSLNGVRDIKILGREQYFVRQYGKSRLRLARSKYLRGTLNQFPSTVIELSLIGFILLFFASTVWSGGGAEGALPVLALFAYTGLRLVPSIQKIVRGLNDIRYSSAPIEDLHEDLSVAQALPASDRSSERLPFRESIELHNVTFQYEGAEHPALQHINLTIGPGEEIGICGPTGGGKTTLTDVLSGLLVPTSGRVTVDGRDVAANAGAWQRNLGVVPQMVFLIDDTLTRNIALGVDDDDVDQAALTEAVELAQLSDFVASLPEGLDSTVGEHGVRISGGQRQRIAIARALYRRPAVLIFDEGTSALDTQTEAMVMESIERLRGTHTIILVAHRLSTVRTSNRVVFLENGRIGGIGSFDSLERSNDRFRALAALS